MHKLLLRTNYPPIGYYRSSDDMYDLGRKVRLKSPQYNRIMVSPSRPAIFIGNALRALFDDTTLMKTGRSSNRKSATLNEKDSYVALDPTKMGAIENFYEFWLKTDWMVSNNKNEVDYGIEAFKFKYYLGKKLASYKEKPGTMDKAPAVVKSADKSDERSTTGKKRPIDDLESENIYDTDDTYAPSTSKIGKPNKQIEEESKEENNMEEEDEMSDEEKTEETDETDLVTDLKSDDQEL